MTFWQWHLILTNSQRKLKSEQWGNSADSELAYSGNCSGLLTSCYCTPNDPVKKCILDTKLLKTTLLRLENVYMQGKTHQSVVVDRSLEVHERIHRCLSKNWPYAYDYTSSKQAILKKKNWSLKSDVYTKYHYGIVCKRAATLKTAVKQQKPIYSSNKTDTGTFFTVKCSNIFVKYYFYKILSSVLHYLLYKF